MDESSGLAPSPAHGPCVTPKGPAAFLLLSIGRRDEAPAMLEHALDEHGPIMVWLPYLPALGNLGSTARFAKILAAMHPARSALA